MKEKILVIRLSSIGDIVLCTPAIRCLARQMDAEIHWLTKRRFSTVLEGNPNIQKTWVYEDVEEGKVQELKKEKFTRIFDMHCNLRTSTIRRKLKAPVLVFDKINIKKWLAVNFRWKVLPKKHLVDRYFDALHAWGVINDEEGMDFFIQEKYNDPLPEKFAVMAIGAAHYTKMMPYELIEDVVDKMSETVVLIGGPGEAELGNRLKNRFGKKVIQLAGKCTIHQSADIISRAQRVITPDTGMMHIAAALQKPIQVIWGNTVPEFGMYPYFGKKNSTLHINHQVRLKCRPCSKIGFDHCPKGHFRCMRLQNTSEIAQSELLD